MIDTKELKIFCTVVEQGSFSKAAKIIYLSQPSITFHIKKLEKKLRVQLFDRTSMNKGKLILKPASRYLYERAKKILKEIEKIKDEINNDNKLTEVGGKLSIGSGVTIGENIIPFLLGSFKKIYPHISFTLKILDTLETIKRLLMYELDIGIVGAKMSHKNLSFEKFTSDKLILIVWPEHRWTKKQSIRLEEFLKEPLLMREEGSGTRMHIEYELNKRKYNIEDLNIVMELGSTAAIKQAVMARQGVAIVNKQSVKNELKVGTLKEIPIEDFAPVKEYYIVTHNKKRTPLINLFLTFLKENYKKYDIIND